MRGGHGRGPNGACVPLLTKNSNSCLSRPTTRLIDEVVHPVSITVEDIHGMIRRVGPILHILDILVAVGMVDEAVKWFVRYDECPYLLRDSEISAEYTTNLSDFAYALARTVRTILTKIMAGNLYVRRWFSSKYTIDELATVVAVRVSEGNLRCGWND